jgi:hypothetical protein
MWSLEPDGIIYDREVDGVPELRWTNPRLPPPEERRRFPVRIVLVCWFETVDALREGLGVIEHRFGKDSVLAEILRTADGWQIAMYTAANQGQAWDRSVAVRGTLRPTAMGMRHAMDPRWQALGSLEPPASSPTPVQEIPTPRSNAGIAPPDRGTKP